MSRGITLLAVESPNYGVWAYQMARSISYFSDIDIQLVYDMKGISALSKEKLQQFSQLTLISEKHTHHDGHFDPGFAKLNLYPYYHYDETIFLDCDGVCVADPSHLFDQVDDYKIQCWGTTDLKDGVYGNMLWMDMSVFRKAFSLPVEPIPGVNSSFQFIRKGQNAESVYLMALEARTDFEVQWSSKDLHRTWGRKDKALPDELFFNAALARCNFDYALRPHPIFFCQKVEGKRPTPKSIADAGACFIGYWGTWQMNHDSIRSLYDKLMRKYIGKGEMRRKLYTLMKSKFAQ